MTWAEVSVNRSIRSATLVIPNQQGLVCTVNGYRDFPGADACYSNGRIPLVIADGGGQAGVWFFGPTDCYRNAYYLVVVGLKEYKRSAGVCLRTRS